VPLGFDLDRFETAERRRGELRRELQVNETQPLVGIVARLVPIKAHEVFLTAARELARRRPDARFVIVGDGERRGALEQLTRDLGLAAQVSFLGWRGDLDRIYADLDLVALTSRNEGSPVAIIEAMAAGRAVVSTRVGGVPDVVTEGETGRLVAPDDPAALATVMGDLLEDAAERARLGAAARRRALATYGAGRLVADVDRLYARLLAARGMA
jgi:glycosyltransferase involved in cell wall biosynthesis